MTLEGASPTQFGQGQVNMWAMLRTQAANGIGLAPFDGVPNSSSYASFAGPGFMLVDVNTGIVYTNRGTKAAPVWVASNGPVNTPAGAGVVGNAKATYDFAVDGGAIATINPLNSPTIPAGAIILGGTCDITTTVTSGGSATIALGLGSGAQAASLKAATAVASYSAGQLAIIPVFTTATYVKVAAAAQLSLTVAVATLTAGKFDINLVYLQGNT